MASLPQSMPNPWLHLPAQPPYVLAEDAEEISRFNGRAVRQASGADRTEVHLDVLPEPFLGDPAAPVVLLALNPGFAEADRRWHADPAFIALCRANLEHRPSPYPFYLLNPTLSAPGTRWWLRRLSPLLAVVPREVVARRVLCVEYFGYHSVGFAHSRLRVPSQQYSFMLVRQALRRGAVVVLTRGERLWRAAVPELAAYPHLYRLHSVQNTIISRGNCPAGFDAIVQALTRPEVGTPVLWTPPSGSGHSEERPAPRSAAPSAEHGTVDVPPTPLAAPLEDGFSSRSLAVIRDWVGRQPGQDLTIRPRHDAPVVVYYRGRKVLELKPVERGISAYLQLPTPTELELHRSRLSDRDIRLFEHHGYSQPYLRFTLRTDGGVALARAILHGRLRASAW